MKRYTVSIRTYVECSNNSALYEIDTNVKYSLTRNKDRVLYANHPYYGWQLSTVAQKIKYAYKCIGKEVLLIIGANRGKTTLEVNIIDDRNTVLEAIHR